MNDLVKLIDEMNYYTCVLEQQLLLLVYENKIILNHTSIAMNDSNVSIHQWILLISHNFNVLATLLKSCKLLKNNNLIVIEEIESIEKYFCSLQITFQVLSEENIAVHNKTYRFENEILSTFLTLNNLIQNLKITSPILNNVTPPTPPNDNIKDNNTTKEDPFSRLEDHRNTTPPFDV